MRIVYCHACDLVSTNVWTERDTCPRCGHSAERVEYRRPWQYYANSAILLAVAGLFLLDIVPDVWVRVGIFVVALAIAFGLSSWGLRTVKAEARQQVLRREAAEETK